MFEWVATGLVLGGFAVLASAAWVIRRLMAELPASASRRDWAVFLGFVGFFASTYLAFLGYFYGTHDRVEALIVPIVFFFGACFTVVVARLMRRTARDLRRMITLEVESATDLLTGLANRREFERCWASERARARRVGLPLSMLVVDVDHFKSINDTLGHAGGDRVLASVGKLVQSCLRETDIAARYGGEEFAVIAPYTRPEAAAQLGERVREAVERSAGRALGEHAAGRKITVSVGVAGCENAASGCDGMFERADEALYAAKRGGRNRVVVTPTASAALAA